jgi:hypothetical protein
LIQEDLLSAASHRQQDEVGQFRADILPLMMIDKLPNPSHLLTNLSNTIPAPLLITIAPRRGVHPCFKSSFVEGFLIVQYSVKMNHTRQTNTTNAEFEVRFFEDVRPDDTTTRMLNVIRSPNVEAIGGAMLSGPTVPVLQ